jgi:phenylpropionate dioxygenase-like ring-hydroxylating dioxygenase large terminal subunit
VGASRFSPDEVRDDFVPREAYFDPEFARCEAEHLWPKVWQMACRLEEIPRVGDHHTYDILTDSIIIIRTGEAEVKAFHNACPHRGTQLTVGDGHAKRLVCPFHGWTFDLDGRCVRMVDEDDWSGRLCKADASLTPVQVGLWGGWAWINMDPDCQPLAEFLEPMRSRCEAFELETLRYAWYKTTVVPANWKTVVEAFLEFYHVQTTHSQMLVYTQDYSTSAPAGRHGSISYANASGMPIGRSPRLPPKEEPDFRNYIFEYAEQFKHDLAAMQTERAYQAAQRLRTEVAADAPAEEVVGRWFGMIYEAAVESGAGWPAELTPERLAAAGFDVHIFPNFVLLPPAVEAMLGYRMRPNGDDPESCLFDIWALERFPPGQAPPFKREFVADIDDPSWPLIFRQDFANIPRVQRGLRSRGFKGARPSPAQERAIVNFHRVLRRFMQSPHADDHLWKSLVEDERAVEEA